MEQFIAANEGAPPLEGETYNDLQPTLPNTPTSPPVTSSSAASSSPPSDNHTLTLTHAHHVSP